MEKNEFADQFSIFLSEFGGSISFYQTAVQPPMAVGKAIFVETVHMSLSSLKVLAFVLAGNIRRLEEESGEEIRVSDKLMNHMGIGKEDWDLMWGRKQ